MALTQIKIRRDSAADFQSANPTLAAGEFAYETDTEKMKVGDGSTAYNSLQFIDGDSAVALSKGYAAGGVTPSAVDTINSFEFASSGNATDAGDLIGWMRYATGHSDSSHGYVSGGALDPSHPNGSPSTTNISRFSFGSSVSSSDVGTLAVDCWLATGTESPTAGVTSLGVDPNTPNPSGKNEAIQYFPFASSTTTTNLGDMPRGADGQAGLSATDYGYVVGVVPKVPFGASIFRFQRHSFAAANGSLMPLSLSPARSVMTGTQSSTTGYLSGGRQYSPAPFPSPFMTSGNYVNEITKVPFASATITSSSDGGDLAVENAHGTAGHEDGDNHGYISGGQLASPPSPPLSYTKKNTIQRFPFANDNNGTDVGDLTTTLEYHTGHEG